MRNRAWILAGAAVVLGGWHGASAAAPPLAAPSMAGSPPAPTPTAVGPPLGLNLTEAVALALRDNRTVRSAYLQRVAERFDLLVAERRFTPTANLVAVVVATRVGGVTTTTTTLGPSAAWLTPSGAIVGFAWTRDESRAGGVSVGAQSASLSVSQPLLRGAGPAVNMAPVRIARLQEDINRLALKATVSDTVTAVVLAYRALVQAQEQLRLAQASRERAKGLLDTNHALVEAGRMAAADIVQTESDLANQDVAVLQAEQTRNSAQLALLRLLALDLRINLVAVDPIQAEHVAVPLEAVIGSALDHRMDYLTQRKALEQDRQGLIIARNNRLWDLNVVAGVQHDRDLGPVGGLAGQPPSGTGATLGLQLNIPLGDYSLRQGEVRAQTAVRTGELALEDLRQAVEAQVRDAVQGVELNWRRLEAARRASDLAARALDLQREKLKAGRASNFEVLSFDADLRAAQTQTLTASIDYLNALTFLDQQIGTTTDTWRIALND